MLIFGGLGLGSGWCLLVIFADAAEEGTDDEDEDDNEDDGTDGEI